MIPDEKDQCNAINSVVMFQGLSLFLRQPAAKEIYSADEELRLCLVNALDECVLAVRSINKQERQTEPPRQMDAADPAGVTSRW